MRIKDMPYLIVEGLVFSLFFPYLVMVSAGLLHGAGGIRSIMRNSIH